MERVYRIEKKGTRDGLAEDFRYLFEGMPLPEEDFTAKQLDEFRAGKCAFPSMSILRKRLSRRDLATIRAAGYRITGYEASRVAVGESGQQVLFL